MQPQAMPYMYHDSHWNFHENRHTLTIKIISEDLQLKYNEKSMNVSKCGMKDNMHNEITMKI